MGTQRRVRHDGKKVDAVALAGKTGFLYVFDRVTGKPLWPIEERPVPKSDMPSVEEKSGKSKACKGDGSVMTPKQVSTRSLPSPPL